MAIQAGVHAQRGTATASPAFPSIGSAAAPTTRALNQGFGVKSGFDVSVTPERAGISTSFGVSGFATFLGLVAALWAVDRYLVDIPGFGRGS